MPRNGVRHTQDGRQSLPRNGVLRIRGGIKQITQDIMLVQVRRSGPSRRTPRDASQTASVFRLKFRTVLAPTYANAVMRSQHTRTPCISIIVMKAFFAVAFVGGAVIAAILEMVSPTARTCYGGDSPIWIARCSRNLSDGRFQNED